MAHDTFLRYGIAKKMLDNNVGNIDTNLVKEILASHKDYPDSICRHEDPLDVPGMRMCTSFSIIMNLSTMEMEIAYSNPCENRYIKI